MKGQLTAGSKDIYDVRGYAKEPHTDNDCGGRIGIRASKALKKLITRCEKCGMTSIIVKGKVIVDGKVMDEAAIR